MKSIVLLLSTVSALVCGAEGFQSEANLNRKSPHCVANVAQFRTLSGVDYLAGCDFHLTGVVTLVDTNRDLLVLQDTTGAVALNFRIEDPKLQVGQLVTLDGTNCCPYLASFPHYPHRPSGWDVQRSFEAPMNWGEYHLTRMRGYLRPPVTGSYQFSIASDNSSELWLSTDTSPSNARRIAFIPRFAWVEPHQWSRFPSQRSGLLQLKAGEVYYIEALQEQTDQAEHLSVAWQVPSTNESAIEIIEGRYLKPWSDGNTPVAPLTNGILRQYWTNFTAGDLTGVGGARPFESALSVKEVCVRSNGRGELPKPDAISLNQPLLATNNYRWVQAEGALKFQASDENGGLLEISDGRVLVQVRVKQGVPKMSGPPSNIAVRVEGVCEGIYDQKETLVPGVIWASSENSISFVESVTTNEIISGIEQPLQPTTTISRSMQGFYGTDGIVTFNDRVFDKDYIFLQKDSAVMLVNAVSPPLESELKVGQRVELGGDLEPSKPLPVITPIFVADHGRHSMPLPIFQPLSLQFSRNQEGRWSELEGVVHSVNTNGTLSIVGKDGLVYLWVGQTPSNYLSRYVDAKLRARGVLMLTLLDAPVLLIPSRNFVDVEETAPEDPFVMPKHSIANLLSEGMESSWGHRVRVIGEITYKDDQSFFIQDTSGAIRVRTSKQPTVGVGKTVEVLAFPAQNGFVHTLTEALVRSPKSIESIGAKNLNLSAALSFKQNGTLIHVKATLLTQKTNAIGQVLELQEQQRVFIATLAAGQGTLPSLAPGSRLNITGVCSDEPPESLLAGERPPRAQFLASLNILLRGPQDIIVLRGPPWWTWKQNATLLGMLLTILIVTLLWVYLLRRRLKRQQAAQLAFSRHVLERLEDERRRIAVNLHDSLGQTLLVIKNHAILAIQRLPEEQKLRPRLDEISGATSQAIEEVRRIIHGLRPYQLDRLGLSQAIRASVNQAAENSSILFASLVEDIDGLFDKDAEIHVYRIVQEAITNLVKHSAATEAAVVIKKREIAVSLSIRDNGRGFIQTQLFSQDHDLGYGLSGIAERTRILGGTLAIESRPGEGTSLTVEVPSSMLKV